MKIIKKILLKNESGMALLMVMGSIALLTWILADLTFETQLNKLKTYNFQDKVQAKLNAESGLNFAMAKLQLYQEGRNFLEKNKAAKGAVKPGDLEGAILQPFVYPIPLPKEANAIQKTAVEEFQKETLLKGEIIVSMEAVSGFLNPNNLRLPPPKKEDPNNGPSARDQDEDEEKKSPQEYIENKILETLNKIMEEQKEETEDFDEFYGDFDTELMVKELKLYVNNKNALDFPEVQDIQNLYDEAGTALKYAPMTTIDELYLLEGWPHDIVDLMKDKMTVHEVAIIALNKITEEQLKILFPKISPEQSEEFFKYRDGDQELKEEPNPFKGEEDFKNLVVNQLAIIDQAGYDERIKDFASAGLKLGVAGKLFKVTSTGKFNRSSYTLTAFVDLPVKPEPEKKTQTNKNSSKKGSSSNPNGEDQDPDDDKKDEKKEQPVNLMKPRVVEIRVD